MCTAKSDVKVSKLNSRCSRMRMHCSLQCLAGFDEEDLDHSSKGSTARTAEGQPSAAEVSGKRAFIVSEIPLMPVPVDFITDYSVLYVC